MIEEYARENSYYETQAEAIMRDNAEGIAIARDEEKTEEGPKMI